MALSFYFPFFFFLQESGFPSIEKMIPTLLLSLLGILVSLQGGHCLVPPNELQSEYMPVN